MELWPEPRPGLLGPDLPLPVSTQLVTGLPSPGAKAATWRTDVAAAGLDCAPSEAFGQCEESQGQGQGGNTCSIRGMGASPGWTQPVPCGGPGVLVGVLKAGSGEKQGPRWTGGGDGWTLAAPSRAVFPHCSG